MPDEAVGTAAPPQARLAAGSKQTARRYAADALREQQPRLIDFIPQKLAKLLLLFLLGLAMIAAIEAVYATRVFDIAQERLPAFDLTVEGSLNNWFTSITLDLAGIVALIVYSLRRHRLDDYHGRYRVWLWAAGCWLWLSVDEAASLHESFQGVLREFAGQSLRETELVSVGLYVLVIGGVALRLFFEMRPCGTAVVAMSLVGVTFAVAVAAHFGWLPAAAAEYGVLIEEGCEMGGSLLLLLAMCLYARYVILDTQGLLAARPEKERAATSRRGLWGRKTKIDAAHTSVRPSAKRSDLEPVSAQNADDDDEDDTIATDDDERDEQSDAAQSVHRLSKAERKALRRQQEKQRKTRLG